LADSTQHYKNHAKIVPLYHYFIFLALSANLGLALMDVVGAPGGRTIIEVLVAAALVVLAYYARVFALRVQDRVIRLEMRLRMREVLPSELQPRVNEFTVGQLVAMRFASDEELPELAAQVLRDQIRDGNTIKQMIRAWEADHVRA
jgi:hypothetical protein